MEETEVKKEEPIKVEPIVEEKAPEKEISTVDEEIKEEVQETEDIEIKEPKKKYSKRFVIGMVAIGIFIGVILALTFVQLEISPQWVTDQTMKEEILFSSIVTLDMQNDLLCETRNITVFENNNPNAIPIMTYNGNNISAVSMNVNDACSMYQQNKEARTQTVQ